MFQQKNQCFVQLYPISTAMICRFHSLIGSCLQGSSTYSHLCMFWVLSGCPEAVVSKCYKAQNSCLFTECFIFCVGTHNLLRILPKYIQNVLLHLKKYNMNHNNKKCATLYIKGDFATDKSTPLNVNCPQPVSGNKNVSRNYTIINKSGYLSVNGSM